MNTLSRIIAKTDFLGKTHTPTFKGTSRVKTVLGGILSLLFCCLVSVGIYFLGRELFEKESPLSNVSQARESLNEVKLADTDIFLEFAGNRGELLANNAAFLKSTTISVFTFGLEKQGNGFITVREHIPVVLCREDLLSQESLVYLESNGLSYNDILCLDYKNAFDSENNKIDSVAIRNRRSSANSKQLTMTINKCDATESPGCDAFYEGLVALHLRVYLQTQFIDISNHSNPVKSTFESVYQKMVFDQMRSTYLTYRINELKTDSGFIFNAVNSQFYYNIEEISQEFETFSERNRTLGRFIVDVSNMRTVVSRKYLKIQELLASAGGFIKAMAIILSAAIRGYSECTLVNRIQVEEDMIYRNTDLSSKMTNAVKINNLIQNTTTTQLNKTVKRAYPKPIGFVKYLKTLFGLGLKSDSTSIRTLLGYFDVKTVIRMKHRIDQVELILNQLKHKLVQIDKD